MRRCASADCRRPATTVLIKSSVRGDGVAEVTATDLCGAHDGIAKAIDLQHRDGELSKAIVEDMGEVAAWNS